MYHHILFEVMCDELYSSSQEMVVSFETSFITVATLQMEFRGPFYMLAANPWISAGAVVSNL